LSIERHPRGRSFLAWLKAVFADQWEGPAALPGSLRLEWRFVVIRWVGIIAITPGLLLAHLPPTTLLAAYAVLGVAAVYNLTVQNLALRRPALLVSGYVTMIGDALLNVALVAVGGGFNSPFYYILYTVTISAAMRYGYGPALLMAMMYSSFDVLEAITAHYALGGPFFFRSGFLAITAILAGYLREQAQRAEGALELRLRQANRLNEATAILGASLDLEAVLRAATTAAGNLYETDGAAIFPGPGLLDARPGPGVVHTTPDAPASLRRELEHLDAELDGTNGRKLLPSGRRVALREVSLSARAEPLATLAVVEPPAEGAQLANPDIVQSFVERVALALEKAALYRTLAQRSADLQRAYADLARAHEELLRVDEMKTNFLANVSHEIRTPLSSIRSFSEILLNYAEDEQVRREFLTIINAESERLTRLLNDVLDITKIESGRMEWHVGEVDLGALLEETARTYRVQVEEAGLEFRRAITPDLPPVQGDRDRLQQVIGNLLNNAVKFTRSGSVTLGARTVGDAIHVSVSDTGIGIAAADQERIFEKFQQVGEVMTDKPRGTGLGLSICREIVDHLGGRIWVESEKGRGSTFTISIAVEPRAEPQPRVAVLAT
jgi:signal transduction histidine kinase